MLGGSQHALPCNKMTSHNTCCHPPLGCVKCCGEQQATKSSVVRGGVVVECEQCDSHGSQAAHEYRAVSKSIKSRHAR
jgi:hypothetical protein